MNKNQFYFKRKVEVPLKEGETEQKFKDVEDSFNINKVIRTICLDDGGTLVLLDDLHQRKQEVPIRNKKGVVTGIKNEVNAFQSEITITAEEGERLKQLISIE